jgi:HK97 family phage major capsid protein
MTPAELRRKVAELREKISAIVATAEKENRETTDDENVVIDGAKAEAESLERRAKIVEDAEANVAAARSQTTGRTGDPIDVGGRITPTVSEDDKSKSFGDFLRCIAIMADRSTPRDVSDRVNDRILNVYQSRHREWGKTERERRDIYQSSGTTGGYLVPTQYYNTLMEAAAEQSIVRQNAMVLPMGADEVDIPILNQTTAPSAGNTSFFGGLTAAWSAEQATISEVQPTFRQGKLKAHELTGYTEVSRTLIQNSAISVDVLLNKLFGGAVAWYEDYAFLRGDGIGKPLGVLNSPALVYTAARGSATAITLANAAAVYAKMLASSRGTAVWVVSQAAIEKFLVMAGVANGVILPAGFLTQNSGAIAPSMTLMGRPVYFTEKMPALNTAGDFMFIDFQQYIVGDRATLEIAVSDQFKFQTNQIAYRFVHRVGGMPWLNSTITLADASTTVSPFVYLTVQ